MARKSHKHVENTTVPTRPLALRAAAYLRISEVKPGQPSESIESQMKIIEEFVDCRPDITLSAAYTDINISGRSFQREGFQQMLKALENIQMPKRQEAYERYILGQYTSQEYKKAVGEVPLPTLQIDQLQAELERLEGTRRILQDRMSALCGQSELEPLPENQLQQIVVSGGVVSKVIFIED